MNYANCDNNTDLISGVRQATKCTGAKDPKHPKDPKQLGPLVLAYIGDTIYDLFVRTELVDSTTLTAHGLHIGSSKTRLCQGTGRSISPYRGAVNGMMNPQFFGAAECAYGVCAEKCRDLIYRIATGMEALVGYLYLSGKDERLSQLMRIALHDTAEIAEQAEK